MRLGSGIDKARSTIASCIVAALGSPCADAAVYKVTNTHDAGPGSLRDALIQANGNLEADTIDLSSISGQTILLTSGALESYLDEITIDGAGVTIDAGGHSNVLYAYDSDVTINHLTITGGSSFEGGGISAKYGSLTLNDSIVTGNTAYAGGGVWVWTYFGDVSINRSQITSNSAYYGGGLYALAYHGDVALIDSVVSGNRAERRPIPGQGVGPSVGGAWLTTELGDTLVVGTMIADNASEGGVGGLSASSWKGDVTIEASTISANHALYGYGGGGASAGNNVRLLNSTFSGNLALNVGGFGAFAGRSGIGNGALVLEFVTVSSNSSYTSVGGLLLWSSGTLELFASIVLGNVAPSHPDLAFYDSAQSADASFSLIGVDPLMGTLHKDAVSTALSGADPLLGPLAANGGPTPTHLPTWTSPLIDAIPHGEAGCGVAVAIDQRGEPRPTGQGCDIGAVELGGVPPPVIPEARAVPVLDRIGLAILTGFLGLLGLLGTGKRLAVSPSRTTGRTGRESGS